MKTFKPLLLKTYGKQRRKITAWILPEDSRKAFDSTPSSDDVSMFEPAKPPRTRKKPSKVKGHKEVQRSTRQAKTCLTETSDDEESICNEENIYPPILRQENAREAGSGRKVRSAKRKAKLRLAEKSDNEENTSSLEPFWRNQNTRKSRLVSGLTGRRQRGQSEFSESEKESSAPKRLKTSGKVKEDSNVHQPSAGRFVTRRKCAASAKPPKARIITLDSSDDFISGTSRINRSSRRKRYQPAFRLSCTESSLNTVGASSFTNIPFREISLNESGDHALEPCSRKPIFCSTPSAASIAKQGPSKTIALRGQVTSPSVSVSCICISNTSQEGPISPQQPNSPPQSSSHSGASDERLQLNIEQLISLFIDPKGGSCSERDKSLSGDSKANYDVELASGELFSADSESSSHFVSAAGDLEWLIEALKQKCLSQHCKVQLERLLSVTQLCSQTTYSSCLERSRSVESQQIKELLQFVDRSQKFVFPQFLAETCFSVTNNESNDFLKSTSSDDRSVTTDHSDEISMDTKLASSTRVHTRFTDEEAKAAKDKSVSKKCFVLLEKSQLSHLHVVGFAQQKEAGAAFYEKSVNQDTKQSEREESVVSLRKSKNRSVAKAMCADSEKASEPQLTEKCLILKRMRKTLQPKDVPHKSSTGVSESASDDQTKIVELSERDYNKNTASSKISAKTASGQNVENIHKSISKREKGFLVSKEKRRRSTLAQQTGTARKACVSGMSVSRWKNKGGNGKTLRSRAAKTGNAEAIDCSISELISKQHIQPTELGTTVNFSTPIRTSQLSALSLLADLSPNTHTWSRLKASLSVHRKVQLTPKNLSTPSSTMRAGLADISQDLFATPLRPMLPRHLRSQLLKQQSLPLCEDSDLSDAEKVYAECGQQHPLPWEECILPHRMKQCVKIGEGTFGEVFSTTNSSGDIVALKIIPVEGREKVNGEDQKTFGEILHEIIISKELSCLKEKEQNQTHGFIGLIDLHCVQGSYPADFLKAWDEFDKCKDSENDRPDFFEKAQLFIVLEFEFGGADLENSNGKLASLGMAKSILHQVTAALAVAEQELHFEHRDLHWGNVLVKTTNEKAGSFLLNGTAHTVETKGVLVRIIDYSLSRVEIDDLTVSCDISNDEELFMGKGDYQFEIYRLMRQENGNDWSTYNPHTNVMWLHYLCSKLLSMKYRSSRGRAAKNVREELTCFYNNVLQYSSATEALQNCPLFQ